MDFCCSFRQALTVISQAITSHYHTEPKIPSILLVRHLFVWQVAIFWLGCSTPDFCIESAAISMLKITIIVPKQDFYPWSALVHGNKPGKIPHWITTEGRWSFSVKRRINKLHLNPTVLGYIVEMSLPLYTVTGWHQPRVADRSMGAVADPLWIWWRWRETVRRCNLWVI